MVALGIGAHKSLCMPWHASDIGARHWHLDVDVRGAANVNARIDCVEHCPALSVCSDQAAHECKVVSLAVAQRS